MFWLRFATARAVLINVLADGKKKGERKMKKELMILEVVTINFFVYARKEELVSYWNLTACEPLVKVFRAQSTTKDCIKADLTGRNSKKKII